MTQLVLHLSADLRRNELAVAQSLRGVAQDRLSLHVQVTRVSCCVERVQYRVPSCAYWWGVESFAVGLITFCCLCTRYRKCTRRSYKSFFLCKWPCLSIFRRVFHLKRRALPLQQSRSSSMMELVLMWTAIIIYINYFESRNHCRWSDLDCRLFPTNVLLSLSSSEEASNFGPNGLENNVDEFSLVILTSSSSKLTFFRKN